MVRQLLRFGDCTLDIAARELRRAGERVELPPTVFDCMAYLVEHRDRAVGRDELVAAVWGKTSISDTMLGKAVLAIRRAVGDDAERQALLRTVPRFGYHWVAAVVVDAPAVPTAVSAAEPEVTSLSAATPALPPRDAISPESAIASDASEMSPPMPQRFGNERRRRRGRALIVIVGSLVVVAMIVGLALSFWPRGAKAPAALVVGATSLPADSCAVLPADIVAEAGDSWLRLGVMDLLATRLRGAGLPVLSSDSVVRLVPDGVATETAAANLRRAVDVQHLVQPALRRSGASWIARVELLTADGRQRSLQAAADNPIAAADAVADLLLGALGRGSAVPPPRTADLPLAELLQRVDAARLSDQLDAARALIAAASPAQRREPELRLREILLDLRTGDLAQARGRIERLLADVPAESDPVMHGRGLESLCVALSRGGDLVAAEDACDRAVALLETQRQPVALGRAYNHRGIVHARQLRREAAAADFARARVVLGTAGDPLLSAMVDANESAFAMEQGRPADALPGLERAGQQFQRFGMLSEFAVAVVNLVEARLALLQPLEALKASEPGWAQRQRIGDPALRQRLRVERADALAANGRLGEARRLLDETVHGADAAASPAEPALARAALARLELADGQPAAAAMLAQQALPALDAAEFTRQRALAWLVLLRGRLALDQAAAAQELTAFTAWSATAAKPEAAVFAHVGAAELAEARGDLTAAAAGQREAQTLAAAQGRPDVAALAAASYGDQLLRRGDLREAAVVIGGLARHAGDDYEAALLQWRLYRALGQDEAAAGLLATLRRLAGERPLPAEATTTVGTTAAPPDRFPAPAEPRS